MAISDTYASAAATAQRLLDAKGATMTITRVIPGAPAAGDRPATRPIRIVATVTAVVLPPKASKSAAADEKRGGVIDSNRVAYIAGQGITWTVQGGTFAGPFEPMADDLLQAEGRTYTVKGNDPLDPDGSGAILHRTLLTT